MQGKLTPAAGIVILMLAATSFAANHVSARVAFDHGASVAAGVLTRATGTALVLLLLMKLQGVVIAVPRALVPLAARWREIGAGVCWAFAGAVSFAFVYYLNANALKALDGRLRTFCMTAVTALVVLVGGAATDALVAPRDATGWLGLALLTVFYCIAMTTTFTVLPKVPAASTAALNFEPIALLALAWIVLGQAVTPLQIAGAFLTVGAIAWLGIAKK